MAKALLFDLDGTLLPMDTDVFVKHYIESFAQAIKKHLDPELFVQALLKGTGAMLTNLDPEKTNEQVFAETFIAITKVDKVTFWPILNAFYEEHFPKLVKHTQPTPWAAKIVEEATRQGYRLVVATNPLFPRSAIEQRLTWAGVAEFPFELITVYEEMSFTKPHPQYYQSIAQRLELPPESCIMIGNDMQEDMCAGKLGMQTFLVENCLVDRGEPKYQVDGQGSLEELYEQLKNREGIFCQ